MKGLLVLLALAACSTAVPSPRKVFHEHYEDFMDVIREEAGHEIEHLMSHYVEYEEFQASMDYLSTKDFRNLVDEMETLPEFIDVVQFLENDNIDILFFLNRFNEMIEYIGATSRSARHNTSGRDFNSFLNDVMAILPKEKLSALFEEKKAEDPVFAEAVENLQSDEWDQIFGALWNSKVFQVEVQTLSDHGIDIHLLLAEIAAIFGQNK